MLDSEKSQLRFWGALAAALLTVTTVIGVMANYAQLLDKLPWVFVGLLTVNILGLAAAFHAARLGLRMASDVAATQTLILGKTRGEIEAQITSMWKDKDVRQCRQIDILGLSLRRELFQKHSPFSQWLLGCLRTNPDVVVRIMLVDPDQEDLIQQREIAERGNRSGQHLAVACRESLETLHDIAVTVWKEQKKRRPEIFLISQISVQLWYFRVDDVIVVSPYLQHHTGALSPAFELRKGSRWFGTYEEQFSRCFTLHRQNVFPPQQALDEASKTIPEHR